MKTSALRFFTAAAAISLCALTQAQAESLTITVTEDSYIRNDQTPNNFGGSTELLFGDLKTAGDIRLVLAVNLTDSTLTTAEQQPGFDILNATLRLTVSSLDSTSASSVETLELFQLTQPFAEGTVNWDNTAGGTFSGSPLATLSANPKTAAAGDKLDFGSSSSLTNLTQDSIGSTLYFLVKFNNEDNSTRSLFRIASDEHTTLSGPEFIINYAAIPEPSTYALIVGGICLLTIGTRRFRHLRA